ncbi:hypothetical protein ACMD2_18727 [Ananas comosus]|uniref:Uncharacterized protein n=1 Tax=Ananas comosus TaxID=4615 RepID=A0A199VU53_ANACO|nr:hypothetical protein ACMD2_18727 [Ananas comosus]
MGGEIKGVQVVGVAGGADHGDVGGDGMMQYCSEHPYRSSPAGGICAFCLQEKLGKLVTSSKSTPFFPLVHPPPPAPAPAPPPLPPPPRPNDSVNNNCSSSSNSSPPSFRSLDAAASSSFSRIGKIPSFLSGGGSSSSSSHQPPPQEQEEEEKERQHQSY